MKEEKTKRINTLKDLIEYLQTIPNPETIELDEEYSLRYSEIYEDGKVNKFFSLE